MGRRLSDDGVLEQREYSMNKWNAFKNNTVVRVSASAGTLVAVAVIAGAGFKWA